MLYNMGVGRRARGSRRSPFAWRVEGRVAVNDSQTLKLLEELAERLGIEVRYEQLGIEGVPLTGGYCRVKGKEMVIIRKKAPLAEKIHLLAGALGHRNLDDVYLVPSLREVIDQRGKG